MPSPWLRLIPARKIYGASTDRLGLIGENIWQKPGERAMVESELNRMCINPMQDKVNNICGMAAEAKEEFDVAREQMEMDF